jgi:predicted small lipoprotein YifL
MRLLLLLTLAAVFAGCGQRGALYLPEDPAETPVVEQDGTPSPDPAAESLSEPAEEDQEEDDAPEP